MRGRLHWVGPLMASGLVLGLVLASSRRSARGDGTTATDGAPRGILVMVAGACPAGWSVLPSGQGRLLVGTSMGNAVGTTSGVVLQDREDRKHRHTFQGSAVFAPKAIAGADGSNTQGAESGTYTVTGDTTESTSGLPFVQLQVCERP